MYEAKSYDGDLHEVVSSEGETMCDCSTRLKADAIADALNALAPGGAVEEAKHAISTVIENSCESEDYDGATRYHFDYGGYIDGQLRAALAALEAK